MKSSLPTIFTPLIRCYTIKWICDVWHDHFMICYWKSKFIMYQTTNNDKGVVDNGHFKPCFGIGWIGAYG